MAGDWQGIEQALVACATDDLESCCDQVHPALAAFRGEELQFIAWLRPFEKGAYHDPLIELLALGLGMRANRLVGSFGGRGWSLSDPIPPVTDDVDLRQRILIVHSVDATTTPVLAVSRLHPYELVGGKARWGEVRELTGGEGWIIDAMEIMATARPQPVPSGEARRQARRVVALGHDLYLGPEAGERLRGEARV